MSSGKESLEKTISYWVGYVDEANQYIQLLRQSRSPRMKKRLDEALKKRDEGMQKLRELGVKADFLRALSQD